MVNVTNHSIERYCERILEMNDVSSMKLYIVQNRERIVESINKMYSYAKYVINMQINGDKSSKNYWLKDNIVLVTDTENSAIITLYKVDFGFGEKTDRLIADNLMEEIQKQQQLIKGMKENAEGIVAIKRKEISDIEAEIERLNQQIFLLAFKKDTLDKEIKVQFNDAEIINKQMEINALKICNSMEYKKELNKAVGK